MNLKSVQIKNKNRFLFCLIQDSTHLKLILFTAFLKDMKIVIHKRKNEYLKKKMKKIINKKIRNWNFKKNFIK